MRWRSSQSQETARARTGDHGQFRHPGVCLPRCYCSMGFYYGDSSGQRLCYCASKQSSMEVLCLSMRPSSRLVDGNRFATKIKSVSDGVQIRGCKKIMVLYMNTSSRGGKLSLRKQIGSCYAPVSPKGFADQLDHELGSSAHFTEQAEHEDQTGAEEDQMDQVLEKNSDQAAGEDPKCQSPTRDGNGIKNNNDDAIRAKPGLSDLRSNI
ncbi:hypothetical protein Dimus_014746 [Dionaea muscipula]